MIISKEIEMPLTNRTYNKLMKKYNLSKDLKVGDVAKIPLSILAKSSHYEIDITCDYCNKQLRVPYKRYTLNTKVVDKYACSSIDCSNQKIKDVCQVKFGVDNPFQSEEIKDKIKETLVEKYGVEHPMFREETKEKIKDTCLERYGVSSYTKTDDFKEKTKATNIDKWGVEWTLQSKEIREKGKKTCRERYGVEYSQQSNLVREKTIKTNLENWGVECNLQSEEIKERIKKTNIEKYGVDNPLKSQEIKERIKKTNIDKYGHENPMSSKSIKDKAKNTTLEKWGTVNQSMSDLFRTQNFIVAKNPLYIKYLGDSLSLFACDLGHQHNFEITTSNYYNRVRYNSSLCTVCHPIGDSKSIKETDLLNYIKSIYDGEIIQSYRDGLEIDIYIPGMNLGFEFNGLYWHSDKYLDKNYHIDKTKYFEDKDIRIIHIWEDDWDYKTDIIKSQIKNWMGLNSKKIWARKCEVKEVNLSESKKFLNNNHIQGFVKSNIKLGLYFDNELVSIMTFDRFEGRKKMEEGGWNLSRFCNKLDMNIIGGASKLLNYFTKNYQIERVVSYADRDWSKGEIYDILKFDLINENLPDYKYIVNGRRVHKSRFRKSNLNTELTENDYTKSNNILRIWDCGKLKYEKKIPK